MFTLRRLAQGQLPRPGPAPAAQQKAPARTPGPKAPPQQAQQPPVAPPAPYAALKVGPLQAFAEWRAGEFRKDVAAVAQKKDRAGLAKLVLAQGFSGEGRLKTPRQEGRHRCARNRAQPRRQGRVGLGVAGRIRRDEDPQRPSRIVRTPCVRRPVPISPAGSGKLAETTKTDVGDWGSVDRCIGVRATAQASGPVVKSSACISSA